MFSTFNMRKRSRWLFQISQPSFCTYFVENALSVYLRTDIPTGNRKLRWLIPGLHHPSSLSVLQKRRLRTTSVNSRLLSAAASKTSRKQKQWIMSSGIQQQMISPHDRASSPRLNGAFPRDLMEHVRLVGSERNNSPCYPASSDDYCTH
jgi:hypothetical protein